MKSGFSVLPSQLDTTENLSTSQGQRDSRPVRRIVINNEDRRHMRAQMSRSAQVAGGAKQEEESRCATVHLSIAKHPQVSKHRVKVYTPDCYKKTIRSK